MIEVTLNQEDHSYMFEDDDDESTTPVKACSESGYHQVTTGCSFYPHICQFHNGF